MLSSRRKSVSYLGHIVSEKRVATDHMNTEKVPTWPEPKTLVEVQGFLGLSSFPNYKWCLKILLQVCVLEAKAFSLVSHHHLMQYTLATDVSTKRWGAGGWLLQPGCCVNG